MNIRSRKSNHRAVNVKTDPDESGQSIDHFIPLLKEKKSSVRIAALNNVIKILSTQNRREEMVACEMDLIDSICTIFTANGREDKETPLAVRALEVISVHGQLKHHDLYKRMKGFLSPIISDGVEHHKEAVVAGCIDALATSCFYNCNEGDSFDHTINILEEIITTEKNKEILNSALRSWVLLLSKLEKVKINKHLNILDTIVELPSTSHHNLKVTSAIAIAFLVSEMDVAALEREEAAAEEEAEQEENGQDGDGVHENGNGNDSNEDDEDYDYDEDYEYDSEEEEEDEDDDIEENEIVKLVEGIVFSNTDNTKKKMQSKNVLKRIIKTLKVGETPTETLTFDGLKYYLQGWRSFIQVHNIKRVLKNGIEIQLTLNHDLRNVLNVGEGYRGRVTPAERTQRNKQRTQNLDRDRRTTSNVYAYHHGSEGDADD